MLFVLIVAFLIGFFSASWVSLVSTTLCIAILATGAFMGLAGETATPSAMGTAFLTAWGAATVASGIGYLFKRLFISGRKRRNPKVKAPVARTFD